MARAATVIGVYKAREDLSGLIKRAMAGEHITITLHGEPAVDLVPSRRDPDGEDEWAWLAAMPPADKKFVEAVKNRPRTKAKVRPEIARAFK